MPHLPCDDDDGLDPADVLRQQWVRSEAEGCHAEKVSKVRSTSSRPLEQVEAFHHGSPPLRDPASRTYGCTLYSVLGDAVLSDLLASESSISLWPSTSQSKRIAVWQTPSPQAPNCRFLAGACSMTVAMDLRPERSRAAKAGNERRRQSRKDKSRELCLDTTRSLSRPCHRSSFESICRWTWATGRLMCCPIFGTLGTLDGCAEPTPRRLI
jgi:hypothetical protein